MHAAYPSLPPSAGPFTDFSLPWRTLAGWTLFVLLAHWALLGGGPDLWPHWQADRSADAGAQDAGTFVTRTIPWVAPEVPAPAPPKATPQPAATAAAAPEIAPVREEPLEVAPTPPDGQGEDDLYGTSGFIDDGTPINFAIPSPVRLKYDIKGEVKGFPYSAKAELLWNHDGKTYDARMEISHFLLGSRVQTSKGLITSQGLEPIRFGDKVRSEVAAHFEREKGKVSFSANTPDAPLTPGAQDHLSVFVQLASLIGANSGRFPSGSTISFQAIGPRSSENWVFKIGEPEPLKLPGGEVLGIKLVRDPLSENDARAELWLVPTLGYLPARIRLTQSNGDFVDQLWRSTQNP
jgi:hypothetical protein